MFLATRSPVTPAPTDVALTASIFREPAVVRGRHTEGTVLKPRVSTELADTGVRRAPDAQRVMDAALVRLARSGDQSSFGELVRRHLAAAHAVALAVLGVREDAEDACQDGFVSALRHLEECNPPENFRPWLLAIVRNRALDMHRHARRRPSESLDGGADIPADAPTPLRIAERSDMRARLTRAIARLTGSQREVLMLHEVEGWTHPEIAAVMGIDAGTSRAHLFAARRALRKLLSAELRPEGYAR